MRWKPFNSNEGNEAFWDGHPLALFQAGEQVASFYKRRSGIYVTRINNSHFVWEQNCYLLSVVLFWNKAVTSTRHSMRIETHYKLFTSSACASLHCDEEPLYGNKEQFYCHIIHYSMSLWTNIIENIVQSVMGKWFYLSIMYKNKSSGWISGTMNHHYLHCLYSDKNPDLCCH